MHCGCCNPKDALCLSGGCNPKNTLCFSGGFSHKMDCFTVVFLGADGRHLRASKYRVFTSHFWSGVSFSIF